MDTLPEFPRYFVQAIDSPTQTGWELEIRVRQGSSGPLATYPTADDLVNDIGRLLSPTAVVSTVRYALTVTEFQVPGAAS